MLVAQWDADDHRQEQDLCLPIAWPHTPWDAEGLVLDALCCLPQPGGLAKSCGTRTILWNKENPQQLTCFTEACPESHISRGGTLQIWWVQNFCSYARKNKSFLQGQGVPRPRQSQGPSGNEGKERHCQPDNHFPARGFFFPVTGHLEMFPCFHHTVSQLARPSLAEKSLANTNTRTERALQNLLHLS